MKEEILDLSQIFCLARAYEITAQNFYEADLNNVIDKNFLVLTRKFQFKAIQRVVLVLL